MHEQYDVKSSEVSFTSSRRRSICISVKKSLLPIHPKACSYLYDMKCALCNVKSPEVSFRCYRRRSIHIHMKLFPQKHFYMYVLTGPQLYDMKWYSGVGLQRPSFKYQNHQWNFLKFIIMYEFSHRI